MIFVFLLLVILGLQIGCLASPLWVEQGTGDDFKWEGSLTRVKESDIPSIDKESYNNVADDVCDLPNHYGVCEMFEDLRDSGFIFIFYECFSILMLLIWIGWILFALLEKS
jgi:hypothetical protein